MENIGVTNIFATIFSLFVRANSEIGLKKSLIMENRHKKAIS